MYYKLGGLGINRDTNWNKRQVKINKMKEYSNNMNYINNRVGPFKPESLALQIQREKQSNIVKSIRFKSNEYGKLVNNSSKIANGDIQNPYNYNPYNDRVPDNKPNIILPPINNRTNLK